VWRGTDASGESLLVDDLTANGYTDAPVTNGTTHYYQVRAVDTEARTGGFSNEVSATPNPPVDVTPPTMPVPSPMDPLRTTRLSERTTHPA